MKIYPLIGSKRTVSRQSYIEVVCFVFEMNTWKCLLISTHNLSIFDEVNKATSPMSMSHNIFWLKYLSKEMIKSLSGNQVNQLHLCHLLHFFILPTNYPSWTFLWKQGLLPERDRKTHSKVLSQVWCCT